ncbi:hypothetical protein DFS33DRAFT_1386782 [Desarmillaria ectypa]|nr:hypothetical protein DFS33DRAFT_1386782 [Desarmillaria ectypa]
MTLDSVKLGGSGPHQNLQHSPTFRPPTCIHSRWSGYYQQPIENDIIDGTGWIDFLWAVLHRTNPSSYCASRYFDSTSRKLGRLTKSHVRTKILYAIYDILEYRGYIESVCSGLINDILQEIKDSSSDVHIPTDLGSESEDSPLSDVLHAERFLKAFRTSFLGRHEELSKLRSWLQELPSWTDENFAAHHWNDRDNNLLLTHYIAYQAPWTHAQSVFPRISRLSSIAATRIYTKVFRTISRSDDGNLQMASSQQNEHRHLATAKLEASTAAPIPVSTACLSTASSSYSQSVAQDTEDSP